MTIGSLLKVAETQGEDAGEHKAAAAQSRNPVIYRRFSLIALVALSLALAAFCWGSAALAWEALWR